jgi:hypothetical protein
MHNMMHFTFAAQMRGEFGGAKDGDFADWVVFSYF